MKTVFGFLCALSLACLALSPAARAQETKTTYGLLGGLITLPEGVASPTIEKLIVDAALGRRWIIRSQEDGKVVLFHQKGPWVSQLTLLYTAKEIVIYSDTTHDGRVRMPDTWIANLHNDIAKKLKGLTVPVK